MSTPPLDSAWDNPRQLSVLLLPETDATNEDFLILECSASHMVLGLATRVHVYSLPDFNLVHTIVSEEDSRCRTLDICGEILVVTYEDVSGDFLDGCSLSIWDLQTGENVGNVVLGDSWYKPRISAPEAELVEIKENGVLVGQEWPKNPTLIVSSTEARLLQVYALRPSTAQSTKPTMLPVTTIRPIHFVYCLASVGRTALTGGIDATVRVWDIVNGECQLVLIGHTGTVSRVVLDKTRVYSLAFDLTVCLWDRHSGDCLQVLDTSARPNGYSTLHITPSYLITITSNAQQKYTIRIRDPLSGDVVHQIEQIKGCNLGPVHGPELTLITRENQDATHILFKIWDIKSGQVLAELPVRHSESYLSFCSQERFVMVLVKQGRQHLLEVWDFGSNESQL